MSRALNLVLMRPPHVVSAIAVTPARLLAVVLVVVASVLLALAIQRRRAQVAEEVAEESLARLRGFHLFGPDDDESPHVHVPLLRERPTARPPVPGTPAAALRAAAVATASPAPAPTAAATAPKPARNGAPRRQPAASLRWDIPRPARAAADPPSPPLPRPAKRDRDLSGTPARRLATAAANAMPAAQPQPDGDVLLVEDDTIIAAMYQTLLGTRGYQVRHAQDGVEGIAMVRERRPALILLDMMMPRMDGIQFLEALRGWPRTSTIPVVVLSNVGDRHIVERAMALGAVEYLVKAQTRPQVLLGALPHWLRGNRALTTLS